MSVAEASQYFIDNERKLRYYAHYHWMRRLSSHQCAAAWTADDIYQETIIRVLENLHQFTGGDFSKWVGVIMSNLACTLIQKHMAAEIKNKNLKHLPTPSQEEVGEKEEESRLLYEAIEDLSPGQGACLLYVIEPGRNYHDGQELCKELGITHTNLRQYRYKAVHHLRKKLNPTL